MTNNTEQNNTWELLKDDELVLLHTIAPLSKYKQLMLWMDIKKRLNIGLFNRLRTLMRVLLAGVLAIILGLTTLTTNAKVVVLEAEQTGWDAMIDTDDMKLSITAIKPMEIAKDEYCIMWLKTKGKEAKMIAKLPMTGGMDMPVSKDIVAMLEDSMIIISVEKGTNVKSPTRIEYMKEP